jgi:hypothetical protein
MPVDPITAAIVGTVVGNVIQEIAALPGPVAAVPLEGMPRMLPENTIRADMMILDMATASVNGQPMMLAPGVQIRDPFNMVVFPTQVRATVPVRYQKDITGAISRVWILSQREAAQP